MFRNHVEIVREDIDKKKRVKKQEGMFGKLEVLWYDVTNALNKDKTDKYLSLNYN